MKRKTAALGTLLILGMVSPRADFTIGIIPDTQKLTIRSGGAAHYKAMLQFFADRKESLNVKFVASVGDMTENQCNANEWRITQEAYQVLVPASIDFAPCQGNHDALSCLNNIFKVSDFSKRAYWGGSFNGGIENAYYLFEAEGMKFVFVIQEWANNAAVDAWVNGIFAKHPDRRGIYATHTGVSKVPGNDRKVAAVVNPNDNVFMATQGHLCETDGEEYWTAKSKGGYTQHLLRTDYQCRSNGGAIVRYYTFKPAQNQVCAFTYDVTRKAFETDAGSQFCFGYKMDVASTVAGNAGKVPRVRESPRLVGSRLDLSAYGKLASFRVHDLSGGEKSVRRVDGNKDLLDLQGLERGRYWVVFRSGRESYSLPIIRVE